MLFVILLLVHLTTATTDDPKTEEIVSAIIDMPAWPTLPHNASSNKKAEVQESVAALTATAKRLSNYANDEILSAYVQIHDGVANGVYPVSLRRNLFLLNRILFELPLEIEVGSNAQKAIAGTLRNEPIHKTPDGVDVTISTWPWILEKDGEIRFDTKPRMLFFQGYFDAPSCFRKLASQFPRRKFTLNKPKLVDLDE